MVPKRPQQLPVAPPGPWPAVEVEVRLLGHESPDRAARRYLAGHPEAFTVLWVVSERSRSVSRWRYVVREGAVYRAPLPAPESFGSAFLTGLALIIGFYATCWAVWLAST